MFSKSQRKLRNQVAELRSMLPEFAEEDQPDIIGEIQRLVSKFKYTFPEDIWKIIKEYVLPDLIKKKQKQLATKIFKQLSYSINVQDPIKFEMRLPNGERHYFVNLQRTITLKDSKDIYVTLALWGRKKHNDDFIRENGLTEYFETGEEVFYKKTSTSYSSIYTQIIDKTPKHSSCLVRLGF